MCGPKIYSGNCIGTAALLGIFAYIYRQRPIIHCIHWWRWRSGTPAAWQQWCRCSQNSTGINWIPTECSSSERNIFDGTPENVSKEGFWYLQNFSHTSQIVSRNFSLCLGLPAAAGGVNCPLHQATVNVKVSFGFSIRLVFINCFCVFPSIFRWFSVLV